MQVTLCEFDELCLNDRLHLIWAVGTSLHRIQTFKQTYLLYSVYGFYVEVVIGYNGKVASVSNAVAFEESNRLNKYLVDIDLKDLGI